MIARKFTSELGGSVDGVNVAELAQAPVFGRRRPPPAALVPGFGWDSSPLPCVFSRPRQAGPKPLSGKGCRSEQVQSPFSRLIDQSRSRPRPIRCAGSWVRLLMRDLRDHTVKDADAIGHLRWRSTDVYAGHTSGPFLRGLGASPQKWHALHSGVQPDGWALGTRPFDKELSNKGTKCVFILKWEH